MQKLTKNEVLMVNIGSTSTGGRVMSVKGDLARILLTAPACTEIGEKVALSRRIDKHWRLVGELYSTISSSGFSNSGIASRMGERAERHDVGSGLVTCIIYTSLNVLYVLNCRVK